MPGSGESEPGLVAVTGLQPDRLLQGRGEVGRRRSVTIDGRRYSCPATTPRSTPTAPCILLGRGSVCINTGGEKVFPEEVEEVLKRHPAVLDAVAVGVPDERFGEAITAVVEPGRRARRSTRIDLIAHVKSKLAAYKAPQARSSSSTRSAARRTARSTTSA